MASSTTDGNGICNDDRKRAPLHSLTSMKSRNVVGLLAVLLLAGAAWLIWRNTDGPKVNLRPSAAVGEVLAEEVNRLLGGKGTIVILSRQPFADVPDANGQRIEAFTAAVRKAHGLKVAPLDWLPRPPMGTMDLGTVSAEQLLAAFDKNSEAGAFLILAGMPPFSEAIAAKVKARSLKLIAVCGYSAHVKRWLQSEALAAAVVPRFGELPPGTPEPKSARDWFDREYQLFTPATLSQLPY